MADHLTEQALNKLEQHAALDPVYTVSIQVGTLRALLEAYKPVWLAQKAAIELAWDRPAPILIPAPYHPTRRDYFAAAVLTGQIAHAGYGGYPDTCWKIAEDVLSADPAEWPSRREPADARPDGFPKGPQPHESVS